MGGLASRKRMHDRKRAFVCYYKSEIARISCLANAPISGTVGIVLEAALPPLPSWVCFFWGGIEQYSLYSLVFLVMML